tara:strand:- start:1460 stop:1702 length:243 start_codon:yes stop_codon:yes gene_type:complete
MALVVANGKCACSSQTFLLFRYRSLETPCWGDIDNLSDLDGFVKRGGQKVSDSLFTCILSMLGCTFISIGSDNSSSSGGK